jgi:hypothetical protein
MFTTLAPVVEASPPNILSVKNIFYFAKKLEFLVGSFFVAILA